MKRTTKLFILIGIISLALGIGTGFLIKAATKPKESVAIEEQSEIVELPVMSNEANPQRIGAVPKPSVQAPARIDVEAEDMDNEQELPAYDKQENDRMIEMKERQYND
jgi:flagellar basal body-associated protein FliL